LRALAIPRSPEGGWGAFTRRRLGAVILAAGVGAFLLLFRQIAAAVGAGDASAFDRAVLQALRPHDTAAPSLGVAWANIAAGDFSAMGSVSVLAFIVVTTCGLFLSLRRRAEAVILLLASGSGLALTNFLKDMFQRGRPPLTAEQAAGLNASFPSGHAMLSATVYLTLGALIGHFAPSRLIRFYVLGIATLLTAMIGLSRIYLGLHWTTDVRGGWCGGAAWARGWRGLVMAFERFRRRPT